MVFMDISRIDSLVWAIRRLKRLIGRRVAVPGRGSGRVIDVDFITTFDLRVVVEPAEESSGKWRVSVQQIGAGGMFDIADEMISSANGGQLLSALENAGETQQAGRLRGRIESGGHSRRQPSSDEDPIAG